MAAAPVRPPTPVRTSILAIRTIRCRRCARSLVALDEWVVFSKAPPPSRVPTLGDGTLVEADKTGFPSIEGAAIVKVTNQVAPAGDWV